jgi:predicted enzyme related to lactoylglutathione lyase
MNPVVHFEIPFDDKEKAKEFYELKETMYNKIEIKKVEW